jgi:hypothetical protein
MTPGSVPPNWLRSGVSDGPAEQPAKATERHAVSASFLVAAIRSIVTPA